MTSPELETKMWLALRSGIVTAAAAASLPVAYPNENFTPAAGGYISVTDTPNTPDRLFLKGTDPHERKGILSFMIYTPLGKDVAISRDKAGKIAAFFSADTVLTYSDLSLKVIKNPRVGATLVPKGSPFAETAVEVWYRCFR